ncbi:MAG TPA: D-alanyl-D-alanine carboxypeptidase/D-alanyl-D-alanine-endopeptidase, partial [Gaiellaceae bacterium]|nr:D-alanyl-D-alanine carboxypeptidase/D-alanyl-D-alanine-endopeptidase [Gaiellaceae bacterium]
MRRRLAALLAFCLVAAPVATAAARASKAAPRFPLLAPSALQRKLSRALRVPHVSPARSAAVAVDLASGSVLFAQNASRPLAPASNEKLPVTFAALTTLGAQYRYETDVLGEGSQNGAVWQGPLVLKGAGDPTLSSAGLRSLALQVRADGVRRVAGPVVGDESWYDARRTVAGWKPGFYIYESPPLSALVVDRDRGRSPNPALAAAAAFRGALRRAGVAVTGPAKVGMANDYAAQLGAVESPPLASIIRFMDHESDNFTAEMLLKELGAVQGRGGTSAAGAAVVMRELADAGVPLAGVRIVDGSGLSVLDRLTANALTSLLRAAWLDPNVRPVLRGALPVAGVNGTLEDRMRRGPAHGTVLAKTGTTSEASALSGFVRDHYAFAVL